METAVRQAVLASVLLLATSTSSFGAPGDLDPSFGEDGIVTTAIGRSTSAQAVAVQADGCIVVAGSSGDGFTHDLTVVRYLPDGMLDPVFDADGIATTDLGSPTDVARSVAIQADERILAAGYTQVGADLDFALVRYHADGSLDGSFGEDGIVVTQISSQNDFARAVAVQPDGRIVVAGYTDAGDNDFVLARYDEDGALDEAFGDGGIVVTAIGEDADEAYAVAIQLDGKIVAAGRSFGDNRGKFAVVRYESDGTLDVTFGGDGKVATLVGTSHGHAVSVAVQGDGKIVLGGRAWDSGQGFGLVRYGVDGSLDPTFGGDGMVTTKVSGYASVATGIALLPGGEIVAAGYDLAGNWDDLAVIQYDTAGALDARFGGDGIVATAVGSWGDRAYAIALQADGKVVVAGSTEAPTIYDHQIAVVRYEGISATCGNGVLESGETCDDANVANSDCCSTTCQFEVAGASCSNDDACDGEETCDGAGTCLVGVLLECDDGDACTRDLCDAIGGCDYEAEPQGTPCADGDLCNGDETCDGAGTCQVGAALDCDDNDACTQDSCDPSVGCLNPAEPATACLDRWERGSLQVDERRPGRESLVVKLHKGPSLGAPDFGDPLSSGGTDYTACIYDDADALVGRMEVDRASTTCGAKQCWKGIPSGYLYKDATASADGVLRIKLKGGKVGRSQIVIKGANNIAKGQLDLPVGISAALAGPSSATVQIHGSDAPACYSRTFDDIERNEVSFFEAK